MDEMDLLLKTACKKYVEIEMENLQEDKETHIFSERFNQKMRETFPFLSEEKYNSNCE